MSNSYTAQQDPSLQARRLWLSLTCEQPLGGRVAKGGPRLPDVAPPPALVLQTPTQEVPSLRSSSAPLLPPWSEPCSSLTS